MGINAEPSQDFYIYSMLFEALKKIDKIPYVTDEHLSFEKLADVIELNIFKCFTYLIHFIGASSCLALLFRDILYCYSEKEFIMSFPKNCYMLKRLYLMPKRKNIDKIIIDDDDIEDGEIKDSEIDFMSFWCIRQSCFIYQIS